MGFSKVTNPAKSTRCNLDLRIVSSPSFRDAIDMIKIQWEREDAGLLGVSAIILFVSPTKSKFKASSSVKTGTYDRFRR
jgi:hypothetical protein